MSTYAPARSAHGSLRILPSLEVAGKPTIIPLWEASTGTSLPVEWFTRLAPFHHCCPLTLRRRCFASLRSPTLTKSRPLPLPNCISPAPLSSLTGMPLSIHELLSAANHTGIDKIGLRAYAGIQRGRSRCGDSAARATGSVPGTLDNHGRGLGS